MSIQIAGVEFNEADPATIEERRDAIDQLPFELPDDYREFLLATKGGASMPNAIWLNDLETEVNDNQQLAETLRQNAEMVGEPNRTLFRSMAWLAEHSVEPMIVGDFYAVVEGDRSLDLTTWSRSRDDNEPKYLPIAEISGGYFVISCEADTFGQISIGYNGEDPDEWQVVAEGFSDFLRMLVPAVIRVLPGCDLSDDEIARLGKGDYQVTRVESLF